MKETRRQNIKNKIFVKNNILNIGNIFFQEHEKAKKEGNRSTIIFRLNCVDNTSYESESLSLFEDGNILDIKKASSIEMHFMNYELNSSLDFSIVNGGGYSDFIFVSGEDQNWVNGLFTRLKETIDSVKPQDNWFLRHKTLLRHLAALGIGTIVYLMLYFMFILISSTDHPITTENSFLIAILLFFNKHTFIQYLYNRIIGPWFVGYFWAPFLLDWLFELWPSIEFDFGPEHLKYEKMRRNRLYLFFIAVILPIIIAVSYDLAKLIVL